MWPALPTSEYYESIRLPQRLRLLSLHGRLAYLSKQGAMRASQVPERFSPHMPRSKDPAGPTVPSPLRQRPSRLPPTLRRRRPEHSQLREDPRFRGCIKSSGTAAPLRPMRFSVYASPSPFGFLLLGKCNTRYGWLARPCPVGTLTRQEAPSLPGAQRLPISGGTRSEAQCAVRWIGLVSWRAPIPRGERVAKSSQVALQHS
jgi:hypothetical protein